MAFHCYYKQIVFFHYNFSFNILTSYLYLQGLLSFCLLIFKELVHSGWFFMWVAWVFQVYNRVLWFLSPCWILPASILTCLRFHRLQNVNSTSLASFFQPNYLKGLLLPVLISFPQLTPSPSPTWPPRSQFCRNDSWQGLRWPPHLWTQTWC